LIVDLANSKRPFVACERAFLLANEFWNAMRLLFIVNRGFSDQLSSRYGAK